jgi:N6-adenosine-specific RNA methylase IME4
MWVTNPVMLGMRPTIMGRLSAPDLVRSWGFEPKTIITWMKTTQQGNVTRGGMGWYFRGATEHVIFAVRGNLPIPAEFREPNVVFAQRGSHSVKPFEFFALVERVSPAPRLELFARSERDGWDHWGNELVPTGLELVKETLW